MKLSYEPRDYQLKGVSDIYNAFKIHDRVIYCLPTRGGKGGIVSLIVSDAIKHNRSVLILVDLTILYNGMTCELEKHGFDYGTIKQNYDPKQITIASKDTYINRELKEFDLCIVDEAHKSLSETFQKVITAKKVLGLTATPYNMDWYQTIIQGPQITELQERKIISKTDIYSFEEPDFSNVALVDGEFSGEAIVAEIGKQKIVGKSVNHYKQLADGLKGMVYCSTIKQSEKVAAEFCENGISAVSITSTDKDRDKKIEDYYNGKYQLLVSVNMFLAGFTIKECEVVIWLRPTHSIIVWMQGNGRGMMYTGKPLIVIDPVGNVHRHGLIEQKREWKLGKRQNSKKAEVMIRTCKECYKAFEPHHKVCPYCKSVQVVKSRAELKKEEGELKRITELNRKEKHKNFKKSVWACKTVDEACKLAVKCGYSFYYGAKYWEKCLKRDKEQKMKVAIIGSRSLDKNQETINYIYGFIKKRSRKYGNQFEVVSGGCLTGPDVVAKSGAKVFKCEYTEFPANWDKYGKAAGPIRNEEIVKYSDAILICWDGKSKGSKTVIDYCKKYGKKYFIKHF